MSAKQYITMSGLITRFGSAEVTNYNDSAGSGVLDTEMLNARMNDVNAEIDFCLSQRGMAAEETVPDILVKIAADLVRACYFQPHPPQAVIDASERARQMLDAIASGQWDWRDLPSQITVRHGRKEGNESC